MSCSLIFNCSAREKYKYAKTQSDVALVSLVYIRFGPKAQCNGQTCPNTFEMHARHSNRVLSILSGIARQSMSLRCDW